MPSKLFFVARTISSAFYQFAYPTGERDLDRDWLF